MTNDMAGGKESKRRNDSVRDPEGPPRTRDRLEVCAVADAVLDTVADSHLPAAT